MNRERIDLFQERQIIIYMIVSSKYLKEIQSIIKPDYFNSPYGQTISKWVLEYFNEFKTSPGKQIKDIFYQKSVTIKNKDHVENVSDFLSSISDEYENSSVTGDIEFILKQSIDYLKIRSLDILSDKIKLAVNNNNPLAGEQFLANYKRVEKMYGTGVSILYDAQEIKNAFMMEDEILFSFPGVLGEVCGKFLRGDLIAFMAAAKKGKSWFQMYLAEVAMFYGYKVLLFDLEMTKAQRIRRTWSGLVGEPRKSKDIEIFKFVESGIKDKWKIEKDIISKKGINLNNIEKEQKKFKKMSKCGDYKIVTVPANSNTIEDIELYLDNFYFYENYIPDIVIIDFIDIANKSKYFTGDHRNEINDKWVKVRHIAKDRNILVVSATHSGRSTFSRDATESDTGEDIRKLAHVGKMIVINQNKDDALCNSVRVTQLIERDGKKNWDEAIILQCLDIGKPYLDSRYVKDIVK